jgi:hypothetical protein
MGVKNTVNIFQPHDGSTSTFRCWCSEILNYSLVELQTSHSSTPCVVKGSVCPEFLPASVFTVLLSVCMGHVKTLCVCVRVRACARASFGVDTAVRMISFFRHMTLCHECAIPNITKERDFSILLEYYYYYHHHHHHRHYLLYAGYLYIYS